MSSEEEQIRETHFNGWVGRLLRCITQKDLLCAMILITRRFRQKPHISPPSFSTAFIWSRKMYFWKRITMTDNELSKWMWKLQLQKYGEHRTEKGRNQPQEKTGSLFLHCVTMTTLTWTLKKKRKSTGNEEARRGKGGWKRGLWTVRTYLSGHRSWNVLCRNLPMHDWL